MRDFKYVQQRGVFLYGKIFTFFQTKISINSISMIDVYTVERN